jgi:hypothetical protein
MSNSQNKLVNVNTSHFPLPVCPRNKINTKFIMMRQNAYILIFE